MAKLFKRLLASTVTEDKIFKVYIYAIYTSYPGNTLHSSKDKILVLFRENTDVPPPQMLKFDQFCSTVTLKISTRSPKPNQVFIIHQCFTNENLVPISHLVNEISCSQESVMLTLTPTQTPTGSIDADTNANRIHTKKNYMGLDARKPVFGVCE